jgi:hypothetical protein
VVDELFKSCDVLCGHYGYFVSTPSGICLPCMGSVKVSVHCESDRTLIALASWVLTSIVAGCNQPRRTAVADIENGIKDSRRLASSRTCLKSVPNRSHEPCRSTAVRQGNALRSRCSRMVQDGQN